MTDLMVSNIDSDIALNTIDMQLIRDVDIEIEKSLSKGDIIPLLEYGRILRRRAQSNGLALVKLVAAIRDNWEIFRTTDIQDDFVNVLHMYLGLAPQTIVKYCDMWDSLFGNPSIPQEVKTSLMGKPIKSLLLLTAAARDDQIEDWDQVIATSNHNEVRDLIRAIRGNKTSSTTRILITMDVRTGSLMAYQDQTTPISIGFLNITDLDPIGQAAILRIIKSAGIMEV